MNRVSVSFLLLRVAGLAACVAPQNAASPIHSGLYVDATHDLGKVSPFALGTNYDAWQIVTADVQNNFSPQSSRLRLTFQQYSSKHFQHYRQLCWRFLRR